MKEKAEKVIFRREYDQYRKAWSYLAVFPEDPANPGNICAVPFHFVKELNDTMTAIFEPFCEVCWDYYYRCTKIIHKTDPVIPDLLSAISRRYNTAFRVCEKIM